MIKKQINIGLFGLGCVGSGLYSVINETKGLKANIKKICVKNPNKERFVSKEYITFDKNDILLDDEINVVVELIDDAEAAFEITKEALKRGKAVVTANKLMISKYFNELLELQNLYQVPILYEASCCASIPIIRNLEEYYDNDLLNKVEGIFNGSTNFILSKIDKENLSFENALKLAQKLGFAESNPEFDVEGLDPKFKLKIILAHAFGIVVDNEQIFNFGISKISEFDNKIAKERGFKIKLTCNATKKDRQVAAIVAPRFVPQDENLYSVDFEYNGVSIESVFSEKQYFVGKGAGSYPTASAVLSDISALTYNYKYEYKKLSQGNSLTYSNNYILDAYISFNPNELKLESYFESITEKYENQNVAYIIGKISLSSILELKENSKNFSLILTSNNIQIVEENLASILELEEEFELV